MYTPDKAVWKSYVWHGSTCFYVSTIERTYDTYEETSRGYETIVWEYDWANSKRGNILLYQAGGIVDHQQICRCLIAEGALPDKDNEKTKRFCTGL